MTRESAAQKKAREAEEAKQAAVPEASDQTEVEVQAEGGASASLDLSKFITPAAGAAEVPVKPGADPEEPEVVVAQSPAIVDGTPEAEPQVEAEGGAGSYEIIVDSIGLAPAQYAARGDVIELDESRAQRLLGLKAVRPA